MKRQLIRCGDFWARGNMRIFVWSLKGDKVELRNYACDGNPGYRSYRIDVATLLAKWELETPNPCGQVLMVVGKEVAA